MLYPSLYLYKPFVRSYFYLVLQEENRLNYKYLSHAAKVKGKEEICLSCVISRNIGVFTLWGLPSMFNSISIITKSK